MQESFTYSQSITCHLTALGRDTASHPAQFTLEIDHHVVARTFHPTGVVQGGVGCEVRFALPKPFTIRWICALAAPSIHCGTPGSSPRPC